MSPLIKAQKFLILYGVRIITAKILATLGFSNCPSGHQCGHVQTHKSGRENPRQVSLCCESITYSRN